MKTILLILPLTGAALLVSAAEPVKPETSSATTTLSVAKDAVPAATIRGLSAADKASDVKLGEKIARSGTLTTKAERSATRSFAQSLNPFAPMKPAPTTPWLSRAAWSTAAEGAAVSSTPIEVRHEAKCGVVICSQ